jgi:uncharacterized protein YabN with tetrapyrrole methylase and pyrophosphatase domain
MTDRSNKLKSSDREKLSDWRDVEKFEPEQILPAFIKEPDILKKQAASERLSEVRNLAEDINKKANALKQEIDKRCAHISASFDAEPGSPLFQAMIRVFNERTNTVTYEHYKRALRYREQLAKEDGEKLKKM